MALEMTLASILFLAAGGAACPIAEPFGTCPETNSRCAGFMAGNRQFPRAGFNITGCSETVAETSQSQEAKGVRRICNVGHMPITPQAIRRSPAKTKTPRKARCFVVQF
ncbi:exported hypothetical protein [Mesorhizobium sp. STM 4661]|nr:exported hypothetical protein [Mesorhizobium sp. STM 4661]